MRIICRLNQRDAIKRGSNRFGDVAIELDVSTLNEEQREALAELLRQNRDDKPIVKGDQPTDLIAAIDEHLEWEKERAVKKEQEAAEEEASRQRKIIEALALEDDDEFFSKVTYYDGELDDRYSSSAKINARFTRIVEERAAAFQQRCDFAMALPDDKFLELVERDYNRFDERNYDRDDLRDRFNQIKNDQLLAIQAKEDQRKQRRRDQLESWVRTRMTDLQQARYDDDLMEDEEIIADIRNDVFSVIDLPRYESLTKKEVLAKSPENDYYYTDEVEYETESAESITDDQYAVMQEVKGKLEEAGRDILALEPRIHRGKCSESSRWACVKYGLLVRVGVDEISVTREFALDREEEE